MDFQLGKFCTFFCPVQKMFIFCWICEGVYISRRKNWLTMFCHDDDVCKRVGREWLQLRQCVRTQRAKGQIAEMEIQFPMKTSTIPVINLVACSRTKLRGHLGFKGEKFIPKGPS